ncbi:hypothetical protein QUA43_09890 [Microcoleus sp. N9_B4]|uniref:DUF6888 family protein n=1 Tax=Microcoleus sp. N9_B4 TaxID=3055386 RepID=UPI002FD68287
MPCPARGGGDGSAVSLQLIWRRETALPSPLYSKVCVTIEEKSINPTDEQAQACLRVCQMFSSYYRDIQLFRFNAQTREVYIFVSDELQVIVSINGLWRFLDETEL